MNNKTTLHTFYFRCACETNFRLAEDGKTCISFNECKEHDCSKYCQPIPGGYKCYCGFGFLLDADGKTCNGKICVCCVIFVGIHHFRCWKYQIHFKVYTYSESIWQIHPYTTGYGCCSSHSPHCTVLMKLVFYHAI